jgi:hypothetical protein
MRHALSDESTWAASVIGSWCSIPGAIPQDEIIAEFKKGKHSKAKQIEPSSGLSEPEIVDVDTNELETD